METLAPSGSGSQQRWLITAALLTFASMAAGAQEVQIECLSFPKHPPETIELLVGAKKTIQVTLQSHALSAPLKVPRLATWKFGKSGTTEDGEFQFTTYGQMKPLSASRQVLVLIRKGRTAAEGFRVVALDAGKTGFGSSKMLMMNLSNQRVAGVVGGKRFALTANKHVLLKPAADRGENLCFADLRFERGGKWRTFFSTNWPVLTDARGLVFIYNRPGSKSLAIHSVVDSLLSVPDSQ